ncbi:hypothetical protein CLD22_17250 [Rubrivivax gelatinosus]|nr:hypothetical protein [Rubrivivax gelatinosus]
MKRKPLPAGTPAPEPSADGVAIDDEAELAALLDAFSSGRSAAAQIASRLRRVLAESGDAGKAARPGTSRPS